VLTWRLIHQYTTRVHRYKILLHFWGYKARQNDGFVDGRPGQHAHDGADAAGGKRKYERRSIGHSAALEDGGWKQNKNPLV
jgi:hypothetical protein